MRVRWFSSETSVAAHGGEFQVDLSPGSEYRAARSPPAGSRPAARLPLRRRTPMLRQALGIAGSIGFFLLAALGLAHVLAKQALVQPELAEQFAWPVFCRPEPIERALFLLGLLLLP